MLSVLYYNRIKKSLLLIIIFLLCSFTSDAKPLYCTIAFQNCNYECLTTYNGNGPWSLLSRTGCYVGCNIGYASCGE